MDENKGGEDYYSDQAHETAPAAAEGEKAPGQEDGESQGEPTALLSKDVLAGKEFKPGDELVLRVTRVMDDQVEVTYASAEKEQPAAPAPAGAPAGGGGGDLASLME